ncbi:MAG TPA: putative quinol monooxygenase [Candidatus Sulfotelmatobacter sp.]|nr:putative quinol monooxygenase [Candidatus Sulfotelmatobacter sp.]
MPFNIGVPKFLRSTAARAGRPLTEHHIVLLATMRASPDCASKLYRLLQRVAEPTRAEVGCLAYDVHRSSEDSDLFFVYQLWEDEDTFEAHRHMDHSIAFKNAAPKLLEGPIQLHKWKILP